LEKRSGSTAPGEPITLAGDRQDGAVGHASTTENGYDGDESFTTPLRDALGSLCLSTDHCDEASKYLLVSKRRQDGGLDPVAREQLGHFGRVEEDVVMSLVISSPCSVLTSDEGCHDPHKPARIGHRKLRY
jgi:hypothetical protein